MSTGVTPPEPDDDQLMDELRAAVDAMDPVPDRLIEGAKAAFVWRTIDQELAHLQYDSLAGSEVLVRSGSAVHLSFATSEAAIEIEIGDDTLTGQVVPPASAVRILFRSGEHIEAPCDPSGQFSVDRPGSGPIRLVAVLPAGDVVTEWFTV